MHCPHLLCAEVPLYIMMYRGRTSVICDATLKSINFQIVLFFFVCLFFVCKSQGYWYTRVRKAPDDYPWNIDMSRTNPASLRMNQIPFLVQDQSLWNVCLVISRLVTTGAVTPFNRYREHQRLPISALSRLAA